jgi:hypothetical protein
MMIHTGSVGLVRAAAPRMGEGRIKRLLGGFMIQS